MDALGSHTPIASGALFLVSSAGSLQSQTANLSSGMGLRFLGCRTSSWPATRVKLELVRCVSSVSPLLSSSSRRELQHFVAEADGKTHMDMDNTAHHFKGVRVKFVLHKECLFGQHFLIIGDDPVLGFWNTTNAIPLEWSVGHVWKVELDLPVGKTILFKFILQDLSGEISWEPGPNRCLQLWETKNTIVVISEDWEDTDKQKIVEEEPSTITTDQVISTEDVVGSNDRDVAENHVLDGTNDRVAPHCSDETLQSSYSGHPLLLPGLEPISNTAAAPVLRKVIVNRKAVDASTASATKKADQGKATRLHQLQEETEIGNGNDPQNSDSECCEEFPSSDDALRHGPNEESTNTEDALSSSQAKHNSEETDSPTADVLQNDFPWGQKIFRQFLINLGFRVDPPLG